MDRPIPPKTEHFWNGLGCVAADGKIFFISNVSGFLNAYL
jgi:hypothetical protein